MLDEYLELVDGRVSLEFFLVEFGLGNDSESLEGLRGGMEGAAAARSCMGSNGVCGKPMLCCQRSGSACVAAMSSGGSGRRGEYCRRTKEVADKA